MADGIVQVSPNSTGEKIDTEQLTVGANLVNRQRIQIAGISAAEIAKLLNTIPGLSDYGLAVREIPFALPAVFNDTVGTGASGPKTTTLTTTGDVALVAAQGGGLSIHVEWLILSNTSAVDVRVDLKDGTNIKIPIFLAATGGGAFIKFPDKRPWKITANTAFNGALSAAVTDVRVTVGYYTRA